MPSSRPAAAPEVTRPASAPVISAMISEARACNSAISTQCCDASTIASATSGRMWPPDNRVDGPLALMIVRTPMLLVDVGHRPLRFTAGTARSRAGVQHSLVMGRHNSAPVDLDRPITHING